MITSIGFNTILTKNYLDLANILIESIIKYSKYNITINCINFSYNFNNNRVKSNTINLDTLNWNNICMAKWLSMKKIPYDITLMIDCDMIALPNVDNIFDENFQKIQTSKFPLFCKHPHDPFTNPNHKDHLNFLINNFTNKIPKMKYVYAHGIFSKNHQYFIDELIDNIPKYMQYTPFCGDEGILNILLTKHQVDYDIEYNYMPNTDLIDAYIDPDHNYDSIYESYLKYDCPVKFYFLHGCKDPNRAKFIYQQIKYKNEKNCYFKH